ncbi:arginine-tRNA-protein transferase [Kushneria avicenniae]|uniref:Aspartate/glutamate leucyltransferase n=1 Tax=Kushneria avicenniae TaxID=402385 RepID=A0A1I1IHB5_9GAMM|nr:arginyltransferase [Kushneria avicenniae]SFC35595.1 arginine-tRNA-protein transferase [Kushneria avicenniae]
MNSSSLHSPLQELRFFLTEPHDCSYLGVHKATTLFMDPQTPVDHDVYSALTLMGFRRSGTHLYRPHCQTCNACVSVRVPVGDFTPDRSLKRTERNNQDLIAIERPALFDDEHYALYERYIGARHSDGEMYPPSENQYRAFLNVANDFSRLVEFRLSGRLVAVAAVDFLTHGLSAIYTFFDPDDAFQSRSLGSWAVIWQIRRAQALGLKHVYLGYWIRESRKMGYKQRFKPLEFLHGHRWHRNITLVQTHH